MSRKFKVLISVLIAVLLFTASGAAVAMAQDEPEATPQTGFEGLLDRIAGKLGITQEELVSAVQQARQEMQEECQATENCTLCPNNENWFGGQWMEKRQQRGDGNQQWMEKRQQRYQWSQSEAAQQNAAFRGSQAGRGRQMINTAGGWQGSPSTGLVD